ncbi:MAG: RnfABCDGE type electron transport complex subunit B [Burkholderiaceae bacterium]
MAALVEAIDGVLPQTQCQRCGYAACRPYAEAIASGQAPINRCPPGGAAGIEKLARLTGSAIIPLDITCGEEGPLQIAQIDEDRCIGCALCIAACPVDAIVGAFKHLHQVITDDCTGCALCLPPCPVDCISMELPLQALPWGPLQAQTARIRFEGREARLSKESSGSTPRPLEGSRQASILEAARARAARRRG